MLGAADILNQRDAYGVIYGSDIDPIRVDEYPVYGGWVVR